MTWLEVQQKWCVVPQAEKAALADGAEDYLEIANSDARYRGLVLQREGGSPAAQADVPGAGSEGDVPATQAKVLDAGSGDDVPAAQAGTPGAGAVPNTSRRWAVRTQGLARRRAQELGREASRAGAAA